MMRHLTLPFCTALFLATACGGDTSSGGTPPKSEGAAPMDHGHGDPHPLGKVTLGDHEVEVILLGEVKPGAEANFDLVFGGTAPLPEVLRGWIGIESGVGSRKARFGKEGERGMHGHVDTPASPLEGSKFWLEMQVGDKTVTASIAY